MIGGETLSIELSELIKENKVRFQINKNVLIKKRSQIDNSIGLDTHQGIAIYCNPLIKKYTLDKIEKENIK